MHRPINFGTVNELLIILLVLSFGASIYVQLRKPRRADTEASNNQSQQQIEDLESENQSLTAALEVAKMETVRLEERLKNLNEQRDLLKSEFKVLADEALKQQSESIQKELRDGNRTQLDVVLAPFKKQLDMFGKQVQETHATNRKERIELKTEVTQLIEANKDLRHEANELTRALRGDVKAQGNWGELVLETLLQKSGLTKGEEYSIQDSVRDEDGKLRQPDVVLNLPGDKHLIIDSKVSLLAYEKFSNTDDPDAQVAALDDLISSIRAHIKGLSAKNYQQLYDVSLDFVLLFIPIEGAYSVAIQRAPELYQEAFDKNIVLVTNTTLWSTLRTVGALWRQEKQSQNMQEIIRQASNLYDKFVSFSDDMIKVGKQMDTAKGTYNEAMNKFSEGRGNLVKRAEDLRLLGLKNAKSMNDKLVDRSNPDALELPESNDE